MGLVFQTWNLWDWAPMAIPMPHKSWALPLELLRDGGEIWKHQVGSGSLVVFS